MIIAIASRLRSFFSSIIIAIASRLRVASSDFTFVSGHDAVFRINVAPTGGQQARLSKHAGFKTTHRLLEMSALRQVNINPKP